MRFSNLNPYAKSFNPTLSTYQVSSPTNHGSYVLNSIKRYSYFILNTNADSFSPGRGSSTENYAIVSFIAIILILSGFIFYAILINVSENTSVQSLTSQHFGDSDTQDGVMNALKGIRIKNINYN